MQIIKIILLTLSLLPLGVIVSAQSDYEVRLQAETDIDWKSKPLMEVIKLLEEEYKIQFLFNPNDAENEKISISENEITLNELLTKIFEQTNLEYKIENDVVVIYKSKSLGSQQQSPRAIKHTINGYLTDRESTESLIGASVYLKGTNIGTTTNEYGFYSFSIPEGEMTLVFSYIGYEDEVTDINLVEDKTLDISLGFGSQLEEVVILAEEAKEDIQIRGQMSQFNVPVEKLKTIPVIFGEEDVLKSMQMLPGIKSGVEGSSGIYVRGGSQDQNLILLDGVPVYNPAHALGIFSIFNTDAIKSVTLTKGGFPARFGGRLSSVVDIRMKEGNLNEWNGDLSIGLISSKMTVSGPVISDKTSILLSARRTYADLILKQVVGDNGSQQIDPSLYFYDLNGKIQHKINAKHRVYLSGYFGKDKFGATYIEPNVDQETTAQWGNQIGALRWNYEINNKLFANTTLTYSNYNINTLRSYENIVDQDSTIFISDYNTGIVDFGGKIDFDYIPTPGHYIKWGAGMIRHRYNPGANQSIQRTSEINTDIGTQADEILSTEINIYAEDELTVGRLKANIGLHFSGFFVQDEFYKSLQPRLGLRYLASDKLSFKAAFSTMYQYINLLASETINLPSDLWVPSTKNIKPQESWLAAVGVATSIGPLELEVEAYYKGMENVLSYKEGATFLADNVVNWEDKVTSGNGESYGAEIFLQKSEGRLTGWVGYTLSWTNRQFDDINGGEKYPFRYDRRHDASIVMSYDINEKIKLSANWIYGTGEAVTLAQYTIATFDNFSDRIRYYDQGGDKNSFRMSPSHRLDWSISFEKQKKRFQRTWVIGFYNSYYRKNPFFVSLEKQIEDGVIVGKRIKEHSLLPIIPSVSYQLSF